MAEKDVEKALAEQGLSDRLIRFETPTRTVAEAAEAIGCEPGEIAKSLALMTKEGPILIVMGGEGRLDNKKFKAAFSEKAVMIPLEENEAIIGHPAGGITPFGCREEVRVYLDESLRGLERIYPAGGSSHAVVRLWPEDLEKIPHRAWVDVSK